ncbi:MAG: bifunctional hydroxymethylpyrimidine kinase/phosphomethylpyrimidine kinase [Deltaproteobacteria bacterium]|nr:MAG: bifunctional hydroxymethylpyrimidine kinase/phosphomethylpyrimidine kinase [Deltaproteobacteria bacterium]
MKTVLIIAGSDPGAGAGLQQDLKVTTLLGTYGLTVVTALTVQNSLGVLSVHPAAPEVVDAQLHAVLSDFPVTAVKVGMLADAEIARTVARRLKEYQPPYLVLDPVLAASSGGALLEPEGVAVLKEEIFPLTYLLTPNAPEAARLTGMEVNTPGDLEEAARRLQQMGPQWVLAKGGHLPGEPVDVLTDGINAYHLRGPRLNAPHGHGSGCALAAAAAAHLARGLALPEAVQEARTLIAQALRWGLPLGHGRGPVNPYAPFARELGRYRVLESLNAAAARLQQEDISGLIPEGMSNLGYAAPYAEGPQDVAAFPGRLVPGPQGLLIPAPPAFGASGDLAAVILAAIENHPHLRAAMNIRYSESLKEIAPLLALRWAACELSLEPQDGRKEKEDSPAVKVAAAIKPGEPPPDLIHDPGDWGREPRLYILGTDPEAVAAKAVALKNALSAAGKLR